MIVLHLVPLTALHSYTAISHMLMICVRLHGVSCAFRMTDTATLHIAAKKTLLPSICACLQHDNNGMHGALVHPQNLQFISTRGYKRLYPLFLQSCVCISALSARLELGPVWALLCSFAYMFCSLDRLWHLFCILRYVTQLLHALDGIDATEDIKTNLPFVGQGIQHFTSH